jgi:hypothetical protein
MELFKENNIEYIPRPYCYSMIELWGHYTFLLRYNPELVIYKNRLGHRGQNYDLDDLSDPKAYKWLIDLIKETQDVQTDRFPMGGD